MHLKDFLFAVINFVILLTVNKIAGKMGDTSLF